MKYHIKNIYQKLNINSKMELIKLFANDQDLKAYEFQVNIYKVYISIYLKSKEQVCNNLLFLAFYLHNLRPALFVWAPKKTSYLFSVFDAGLTDRYILRKVS